MDELDYSRKWYWVISTMGKYIPGRQASIQQVGTLKVMLPCAQRMKDQNLQRFIDSCRQAQPYPASAAKQFFEGVVCFPVQQELLLQAFLYLNVRTYFPTCQEMLLFEAAPNLNGNTDQGKCDFVFLTQQGQLLLIETKFISDDPGDTKRTRRTKQRKQVIDQVQTLKTQFCHCWDLPANQIHGAIFTTDPTLEERSRQNGIDAKFISISDLDEWRQRKRDELT